MPDTEIIFAIEESPEGGLSARALGHSIHTQADTLEELRSMVQDAVRCQASNRDDLILDPVETNQPRAGRVIEVTRVICPTNTLR